MHEFLVVACDLLLMHGLCVCVCVCVHCVHTLICLCWCVCVRVKGFVKFAPEKRASDAIDKGVVIIW